MQAACFLTVAVQAVLSETLARGFQRQSSPYLPLAGAISLAYCLVRGLLPAAAARVTLTGQFQQAQTVFVVSCAAVLFLFFLVVLPLPQTALDVSGVAAEGLHQGLHFWLTATASVAALPQLLFGEGNDSDGAMEALHPAPAVTQVRLLPMLYLACALRVAAVSECLQFLHDCALAEICYCLNTHLVATRLVGKFAAFTGAGTLQLGCHGFHLSISSWLLCRLGAAPRPLCTLQQPCLAPKLRPPRRPYN